MKENVLIVDDDPLQRDLLSRFIHSLGYNSLIMTDGQEVLDFFTNKKPVNDIYPQQVLVMMLDLSMKKVDGMSVLKQMADIRGDLQVVVLTAGSDVSSAVSAINLGAIDYIVKGEKDFFSRVAATIRNSLAKRYLKQQVYNLERKNNHQVSFSDLIGVSREFLNTINLAKKASNSNIPVLIEGEPGSGKELLARAIHGSGSKSGKPFVMVDCEFLQHGGEIILFGSEKSLKEGIYETTLGKIREADGGTVFLNNVGMLNPEIQVKLLRFIREGVVDPVGSKSSSMVMVRVISSTNQDLESLIQHGRFREDLYRSLNMFPILIPSLADRGFIDIQMLAENFCRDFSIAENKKITSISDEALQMLSMFEWKDNVRELKNYIFKAVVICDGKSLEKKHFPQLIEYMNFGEYKKEKFRHLEKKECVIELFNAENKCKNLEEIEVEIFTKLLGVFDGNLSEVSKQLKVGRSTIYRKLKP
ncbi:MAG: Fis family two component sigma-54 specific transcriptional regulator [Rickettsiaceae bacterium]|jgi:DNA-binding NtrC family response regulator|nr:Fis family two component sigma-54 specific transcriptional regulator [Rickettsiaceae bacterium]